MKKLSEIPPGTTVLVKEVAESDYLLKLMEMGFIPGETVKVEKIAPLGDPISVHIAGYQLSLRLNEAEHIWVE
ncbi:MAG: ferrous iron transport protein A [Chitinophagaceae bacterium]|nr:ferrous iron transport protein A [Chitinophagaceae bacterium]MCW5929855.1 ferrous iron transport protein A [Chitinophagaceae bacterium]